MGSTRPQAEGVVLGVGAKMFTIAGTVVSRVYGGIDWITTFLKGELGHPTRKKT